jgi:hypothetical protein
MKLLRNCVGIVPFGLKPMIHGCMSPRGSVRITHGSFLRTVARKKKYLAVSAWIVQSGVSNLEVM